MNFYIVFTKNRKKFDKYVKVNRIRNKVIIDINQQLTENDIFEDYEEYKDYFNVLIYTKIVQSMEKNKDIYYLPDFDNNSFDIKNVFNLKDVIVNKMNFNALIFFDEFEDDNTTSDLLSSIDIFDASQLLKSY